MCLPLTHLTSVSTNEVPAGGSVLAGIGQALIQLLLAVAPGVAQGALAVVRVASIDADARVLAQAVGGQPWGTGGRRHVTEDTGRVRFRPTLSKLIKPVDTSDFIPHSFMALDTGNVLKINKP